MLTRLIPRRVRPVPAAVDAALQRPACVPDGQTHTEFVARQAVYDFREGLFAEGRINMAHALWLAWTKREQVPPDVARELYTELTDGCWGPALRGER